MLGIKAFGWDKLPSCRVQFSDAYLLVACLGEFLMPYAHYIVNIGDAGLLIGLVGTVCHAFLFIIRTIKKRNVKAF